MVKAKKDNNEGPSQIAKSLHISRASVYRILKSGSRQRPGPKQQYDKRKLLFQVRKVVKNLNNKHQRVTCNKVLPYLHEKVSIRTLQKVMKQDKALSLQNIPKRIILTKEQRKNRMEHVREWFKEKVNFKKVIFSDEARFSLDGPDNFKSWQLVNEVGDYNRTRRAFDGGGVMVHGVVGLDGCLYLNLIEGTLDSKSYVQLLKDKVMPLLNDKFGKSIILQQDNARPHVSNLSKKFFEDAKIKTLKWPAHSPDLSVIENCWKMLKNIIYDGPDISNKQELKNKIMEGVTIFNQTKSKIVKKIQSNIEDRYLDVLIKHGAQV